MIWIHLTQPHTHAGQPHQVGDRIKVTDQVAEWLIDHDRGELIAESEPITFSQPPRRRKRRTTEDHHHGE